MARSRIRSAVPFRNRDDHCYNSIAADSTMLSPEQVARQASPKALRHPAARKANEVPNADTSDLWANLKWKWITHSAKRKAERTNRENYHDLVHSIALTVVEHLLAGVPEKDAYNRAESMAQCLTMDDVYCGMTGDQTDMVRSGVTVFREQYGGPNPAPDSVPKRSLTRGDWRALETFLRRQLPDPNGKKPSTTRSLMEGLLLQGKTMAMVEDEIGLAHPAAAVARSRGIRACEYALGLRDTRTYDKRRV